MDNARCDILRVKVDVVAYSSPHFSFHLLSLLERKLFLLNVVPRRKSQPNLIAQSSVVNMQKKSRLLWECHYLTCFDVVKISSRVNSRRLAALPWEEEEETFHHWKKELCFHSCCKQRTAKFVRSRKRLQQRRMIKPLKDDPPEDHHE